MASLQFRNIILNRQHINTCISQNSENSSTPQIFNIRDKCSYIHYVSSAKEASGKLFFSQGRKGRRRPNQAPILASMKEDATEDDSSTSESSKPTDSGKVDIQIGPDAFNSLMGSSTKSSNLSLIERNRLKRESLKKNLPPNLTKPSDSSQKGPLNLPLDSAASQKQLLMGISREDELRAKKVLLKARAMAALEAWRDMLPFSILEFFYGPDGESFRGKGPAVEAQLVHNLYFKGKFRMRDPRMKESELLSKVFSEGSGFEAFGSFPCQTGLMFYGKLNGEAEAALGQIQARLDADFPGLRAILGRDDVEREAMACLVAPSEELITFSLPPAILLPLSLLSLAAAACFTLQSMAENPTPEALQGSPTWLPLVAPCGLVFVHLCSILGRRLTANAHGSFRILDTTGVLPSPVLGSMGSVTPYKGYLQNRAVLLDLSVGPTLASLAASLGLLGFGASGSEAFPGTILVSSDVFSVAPFVEKLAYEFSSAVFVVESTGGSQLAMDPFVAAGLMGLQLTALNLMPIGILDGGRIVTGCWGRSVQHLTTTIALVCVGLSLVVNLKWIGALWVGYMWAFARKDDWFQWDELTDPGVVRTIVGCGLVGAATLCMLPL